MGWFSWDLWWNSSRPPWRCARLANWCDIKHGEILGLICVTAVLDICLILWFMDVVSGIGVEKYQSRVAAPASWILSESQEPKQGWILCRKGEHMVGHVGEQFKWQTLLVLWYPTRQRVKKLRHWKTITRKRSCLEDTFLSQRMVRSRPTSQRPCSSKPVQ